MSEQPENFGFGEDETMLRDAARRFFDDHYSPDKLHALVAHDSAVDRPNEVAWNRDHWAQVVELGWPAVCVPEAEGGVGMPLVAAVALAEETGRAGFPSPLLGTLQATCLLRSCGTDAARQALRDIAGGTATGVAIHDRHGDFGHGRTDVTAVDGRLGGQASFVQDARKADRFVVRARNAGGCGLYLVEADADGLTILPDAIIDLTRDQATLSFEAVDAVEVAAPGEGDAAVARALPAMLCIVCADMVGSGEWLLQTTVEYATTRTQFDRPLGFFQAIKHPLVNLMVAIDGAKSLTYNAACAVDHDPDGALRLARMAKSAASDMAVRGASRAVQFHGGIGFTWECYVHLFFKRQMHNHVLLGDARHHRALLADEAIGALRPEAAARA